MNQTNNFLNRTCPVCNGETSVPFLQKLDIQLVQCSRCSMIYVNPVPLELATGSFYDHAGDEYLTPEKLGSDYADVRFERELRLFRSHCKRGSVLDVGCSSGGFLFQLKKRYPDDYTILGMDVSTKPLEHAAKMGIPILKGEFLTQSFNQKFDAVTFWAVMEHLSNPAAFLKKAASILNSGGYCFILTPNMHSLAVRLIGSKYRYIFKEHLNYFAPNTIKKFTEIEFDAVEIRSTHFNPLVIWQDFRAGERAILRKERVALLQKTTQYKQSTLLRPIKMVYSLTECILANLHLADNISIVGRKPYGSNPR